jgi:hypothetical protein
MLAARFAAAEQCIGSSHIAIPVEVFPVNIS